MYTVSLDNWMHIYKYESNPQIKAARGTDESGVRVHTPRISFAWSIPSCPSGYGQARLEGKIKEYMDRAEQIKGSSDTLRERCQPRGLGATRARPGTL